MSDANFRPHVEDDRLERHLRRHHNMEEEEVNRAAKHAFPGVGLYTQLRTLHDNLHSFDHGDDHFPDHQHVEPDFKDDKKDDKKEDSAAIQRNEALDALEQAIPKLRVMLKRKNRAYGNAWRRQGYMGNLARVLSKAARLEEMQWCDSLEATSDEEGVEETALDMMNLLVFMLENYRTGNRWGRESSPHSSSLL